MRTHRKIFSLLFLTAFCGHALNGQTSFAQTNLSLAQMELNKYALDSLPVLPSWLELNNSSLISIQPEINRLRNEGALINEGVSAHTGGALLNIGKAHGEGILGEPGLHLISLGFDENKDLSLVFFMVQRGWQDQHVNQMIERLTDRYEAYALPITVRDGQGENSDQYVVFDLKRFVVEVAIPEAGSFAQVTFATREIYEKIKKREGMENLLLKGVLAVDQ